MARLRRRTQRSFAGCPRVMSRYSRYCQRWPFWFGHTSRQIQFSRVSFENQATREIGLYLLREANLRLAWSKELAATPLTVSVDNEPVSVLFRRLREDSLVCAYRPTEPKLWQKIRIRPCETREIDCQFGASKPFPMPRVVTLGTGEQAREKVGPFLCGGPEYRRMIKDGTFVE